MGPYIFSVGYALYPHPCLETVSFEMGRGREKKNISKQIILWSKNENILLKRAPQKSQTSVSTYV